MKRFFKIIGIINFCFILVLLCIYLICRESNEDLVLRNASIILFFINLISFTIIATIMLNIDIRKKLNDKIKVNNKRIFKFAKGITIFITILILTFGLLIELAAFAFSTTTERIMKIDGKWIIASYYYGLTDPDDVLPEFYYPVNIFCMRSANLSVEKYDELRYKFKDESKY